MSWWMLLVVTVAVCVLAAYAIWTAGRVDRLHHRVAAARARLDAELAQRAALVAEMAASGLLDPASSLLLMDAAHRARTAAADEREQCESALTRAIALVDAKPEPWAGELATTGRRVQLARRFHNDLVATTRNLRRRRLVTWFHLAGHASLPTTIELDDAA